MHGLRSLLRVEMRVLMTNIFCLVVIMGAGASGAGVIGSRLGHEEGSALDIPSENLHPDETPKAIPQTFVLLNDTLFTVLDRIATPGPLKARRAIIFTTLRFDGSGCQSSECEEDGVLGMVASFCSHLSKHGLLRHTMLITTAEDTWQMLNERGLPVYLDRAFPSREAYARHPKLPDTPNREFDVQKHWWGWKISSTGYRVVYVDSDAAVLGDLLSPFNHPFKYDVQGLTDWQDLDHPELDRAYTLAKPCVIYRLKSVDGQPREAAHWIDSWSISDAQQSTHPLVPNPCQSTGLWYLRPTKPAIEFMETLVKRILYHRIEEWEQTAWNDILVHFLWGAGDHEPLKYRALPQSQFANLGTCLVASFSVFYFLQRINESGFQQEETVLKDMHFAETYRARSRLGMPQDQITLHMGGISGDNKRIQFQEEGLWDGSFTVNNDNRQIPLWQRLATKPSDAGIFSLYSKSTWMMILAFITFMILMTHLQRHGAARRWRMLSLKSVARRFRFFN